MSIVLGLGEEPDGQKRKISGLDRYQFDGFRFKRIVLTVELETREDVSKLIDFLVMSQPCLDERREG